MQGKARRRNELGLHPAAADERYLGAISSQHGRYR
jgi:hypothetical protein